MLTKKQWRCVHSAYLYADGHLVVVFEEYVPRKGTLKWVEQWESIPGLRLYFPHGVGRLVMSRGGALPPILNASEVRCHPPAIENGSTACKEKGLEVAYVDIVDRKSGRGLTLYDFPGLLSGDIAVQTYDEKFNPAMREWGYDNLHVTTHRTVKESDNG